MKISIIGSGYVGLCSAVGFGILGNTVILIDIDKKKVEMINNGKLPFYEEYLEKKLSDFLKKKKIFAATDINEIKNTDVTFIAVGTPSRKGGSLDTKYLESASDSIGTVLKDKKIYHVVVVKSTVLPGTTEELVIPILERVSGKKAGKDFGICVNPEFLREGSALEDFLNPDRTVIGELDKKSGDVLDQLYGNIKSPMLRTNLKTAEMIKYASNAFLATKISFINEIGNICKKLGIDVYDVAKGMGYDARIGEKFLNAGSGFGGSCFKKDVSALANKAEHLGVETSILKSVLNANEKQKMKIIDLLKSGGKNLRNRKIAVLGLAFKPGTDDVRDSVAITVIDCLIKENAKISAYDPKAMENMKKLFPHIEYAKGVSHALENADACLILTDWPEFKKLTDRDFLAMKNQVIIEGRRALDRNKVKYFEGICW